MGVRTPEQITVQPAPTTSMYKQNVTLFSEVVTPCSYLDLASQLDKRVLKLINH